MAAALDKSVFLKEEKLISAFAAFDTDGSGKISAEEMMKIIASRKFLRFFEFFEFFFMIKTIIFLEDESLKGQEALCEKIIKEVDKNNDGEIDYLEFLEMMKSKDT